MSFDVRDIQSRAVPAAAAAIKYGKRGISARGLKKLGWMLLLFFFCSNISSSEWKSSTECECKNRHNIDKNVNEIETHDPPRTRNWVKSEQSENIQLAEYSIFFLLDRFCVVVTSVADSSFVLRFFFSYALSLSLSPSLHKTV